MTFPKITFVIDEIYYILDAQDYVIDENYFENDSILLEKAC